MNKEHLEEIKATIKANKDYKEHYHLSDYFVVEYIDELVQELQRKDNIINELEKYIENTQNGFPYTDFIKKSKLLDKLKELKEGK